MKSFLQNTADWLRGVPAMESDEVVFTLLLDSLEIGCLRREEGQWVFEYANDFKAQDKVVPITDFPEINQIYKSADLWPFFALRIPSLGQPSVQRYLEKYCHDELDEAVMLERFGRRSVANPFILRIEEARTTVSA